MENNTNPTELIEQALALLFEAQGALELGDSYHIGVIDAAAQRLIDGFQLER